MRTNAAARSSCVYREAFPKVQAATLVAATGVEGWRG